MDANQGAESTDLTVMIIDDHEVVRRGIAEVIDRSEGMSIVAEAGSVAEGLRRAELVHPAVMLVDLQLPDGTGIDLIKAVHARDESVRAIVLTSFDDDVALAAALDAGAVAYVLKSVRGAEIADVVRAVGAGRVLLDEKTVTRRRKDHDDPTEDLTPSELKVVNLIGEGLSNREIAERLSIAEKTVKNHITSLLAKMGLQRRTQVAAWAAARRNRAWSASDNA
ncbi:LuxR family two component transcriptional regulator [Rarobacter incanus]|uniref:LuxR family two component transcriptional regulator n=2 Tax=Rarobacter incanus TaxID=153494 RepID=A0A542SN33_9MICO|nr:LuxR family two component transcriptional regulator [Rarobacter incanus]